MNTQISKKYDTMTEENFADDLDLSAEDIKNHSTYIAPCAQA